MRKLRKTTEHTPKLHVTIDGSVLRHFLLHPEIRADWELFAKHIENGGKITAELREFIVRVLREQEKRPAKRLKTESGRLQKYQYASFVHQLESRGSGRSDAVQKAADRFGVTTRTIQNALVRRLPRSRAYAIQWADFEILGMYYGGNPGISEGPPQEGVERGAAKATAKTEIRERK